MLDCKAKESKDMSAQSMALENPVAGHVIHICIEKALSMEQVY